MEHQKIPIRVEGLVNDANKNKVLILYAVPVVQLEICQSYKEADEILATTSVNF